MTEAGIPRDRALRACVSCATQKLKCSGDPNGCRRCLQNAFDCQYPQPRRSAKRAADSHRESSLSRRTRARESTPVYEDGGQRSLLPHPHARLDYPIQSIGRFKANSNW
ncbi:Zn(II)2Cys6 transcription factor domain-containing protein [Aspergillus lucknowensis]|uniref:Zn(2)-C6 fungal-type domain-containing protein n=1 Tax=Aspergillus lucknowensis TaxID=176173 RepID=A0ABR4L8I0_9EURO